MPAPSTIAGDVTAFVTSFGTLGGALVTWKVLLPARRKINDTKDVVDASHEIVNSQRTAMQQYIEQLQQGYPTGTPVPTDKSLETAGESGNG